MVAEKPTILVFIGVDGVHTISKQLSGLQKKYQAIWKEWDIS